MIQREEGIVPSRKWLFNSMIILLSANLFAQIPEDYAGKPYSLYPVYENIQSIPGKIELAWYDLGGEGIAFHDNDAENQSTLLSHSRGVPPGVPDSIPFFRENEGVDISYIKYWVDYQQPNLVIPDLFQQYIGWQEDGEWTNYTIDVKVPGKYKIAALYSNQDNLSSLWINNKFATNITLPEDTGYWHIWNKGLVGEITFTNKGLNLLTLKYNAGANLAYLDFILVEAL